MRRLLAAGAILFLLIMHHGPEVLPVPEQYAGPRVSWADKTGWAVWYEDETFEDCATDPAKTGQEPDQCSDAWGAALPYRFPSEEACLDLSQRLSRKAAEEFTCRQDRPPTKQDDNPAGTVR